jgi:hypothetical protein
MFLFCLNYIMMTNHSNLYKYTQVYFFITISYLLSTYNYGRDNNHKDIKENQVQAG